MRDERTNLKNVWTSIHNICSLMVTLTPYSRIQLLRDIREFFGISFKIVPHQGSKTDPPELLFACYGTGYVNANRSLA